MPLIAYDRAGNVVVELEFLVVPDGQGSYGLVDFEEAERSGLKLRSLWEVSGASGSCHWPEHLGERFHEFRVERDRRHNLSARRLVHRGSGHVRERTAIEAAVQQAKAGGAKDVRHLLGAPHQPMLLENDGRTRTEPERDAHPRGRPPMRVVRRP